MDFKNLYEIDFQIPSGVLFCQSLIIVLVVAQYPRTQKTPNPENLRMLPGLQPQLLETREPRARQTRIYIKNGL